MCAAGEKVKELRVGLEMVENYVARAECGVWGGELASIHTEEEAENVREQVDRF